ncbi:MAG: hypothetical protein SOW80_05895, partial [Anaerovoracaceae bacterium]|nr:hypothetical protein [Anaerovoracaceae bacterium]
MKTVCVIYRDFIPDSPAVAHNYGTLKEIFGDYIQIRNCSLKDLQEKKTVLEGDAYLVSRETLLAPLRDY